MTFTELNKSLPVNGFGSSVVSLTEPKLVFAHPSHTGRFVCLILAEHLIRHHRKLMVQMEVVEIWFVNAERSASVQEKQQEHSKELGHQSVNGTTDLSRFRIFNTII